jgi:hypothetical protein
LELEPRIVSLKINKKYQKLHSCPHKKLLQKRACDRCGRQSKIQRQTNKKQQAGIKESNFRGRHMESILKRASLYRHLKDIRLGGRHNKESKLRRQAYTVKQSKLRRQAYKREQA